MNYFKPTKAPSLALISLTLLSLGSSQLVFAADTSKELDITMTLVEEPTSPTEIINRIPLPPASTSDDLTAQGASSAASAGNLGQTLNNNLDDLSQQLESTTKGALDSAADTVTNSLNDTISSGHLDDLPGDVIDKLPETIPGDLLPKPDDLIPEVPTPLPDELPPLLDAPDSAIDSALDDLENSPLDSNDLVPPAETLTPEINTPEALPEQKVPELPAPQVPVPEPLPTPELPGETTPLPDALDSIKH